MIVKRTGLLSVWIMGLSGISVHGVGHLVQHYIVTMSMQCYKLVPVLIWPYVLPGCKAHTINQPTIKRDERSLQYSGLCDFYCSSILQTYKCILTHCSHNASPSTYTNTWWKFIILQHCQRLPICMKLYFREIFRDSLTTLSLWENSRVIAEIRCRCSTLCFISTFLAGDHFHPWYSCLFCLFVSLSLSVSLTLLVSLFLSLLPTFSPLLCCSLLAWVKCREEDGRDSVVGWH